MNSETIEKEYIQKVYKNIDKLKKIFKNFFEYNTDFNKDNETILNEIEYNIKKHVQTITLVNQYVNEIIKKTHEKYTIKNIDKIEDVNDYLNILYTCILNDVYNFLYPNSWY